MEKKSIQVFLETDNFTNVFCGVPYMSVRIISSILNSD